MQAQEPGKRIVSRGAYAANIGKKVALFSASRVILTFSAFSLFAAGVGVAALLLMQPSAWLVMLLLVSIPLLGGVGLCLLNLGRRATKEAKQINTGVPLTRANTADLPAPDSLVRASQEPTQAQEGILLRAATPTQAGQEEQLLRAATGQE